MRKDVTVTYFSDIIGRFDREKGKIYGVSVITEGKAKGMISWLIPRLSWRSSKRLRTCPMGG
jgi:hypothetical protein